MDVLLWLIGVLLAVAAIAAGFVIPILSILNHLQLRTLEQKLSQLEHIVAEQGRQLRELDTAGKSKPPPKRSAAGPDAAWGRRSPSEASAPQWEAPVPAAADLSPPADIPTADPNTQSAAGDRRTPGSEIPTVQGLLQRRQGGAGSSDSDSAGRYRPEPAPPPPDAPISTEPQTTLEERIGLTWLTRVGAVVFILGAAFFFKYAADNDYIGPTGRVGVGLVVGLCVLGLAEHQRAKARAIFVHALTGVGLAVLLATVYASHAFYKLVPTSTAFAAFAAISVLGGALALRHRAQLILIVSVLAALANPILLSTGEDRPVSLFAYLLVMTSATITLSVRAGFSIPVWIAVVGSSCLWMGWYTRFFDIDPPRPPSSDSSAANVVGAYFSLISRWPPLAAVIGFGAQWYATSEATRRRVIPGLNPLGLLVLALVAPHAGLTLLLHDEPALLGAVMVVLGCISVLVLAKRQASTYLWVPLAASFCGLLATVNRSYQSPSVLLTVVGLWALVYGIAATWGEDRHLTAEHLAKRLPMLGCILAASGLLSGVLLLPGWEKTFGVTMIVLSSLAAVLSMVCDRPVLALLGGALSLGGLFFGVRSDTYTSLVIVGVWAIPYVSAFAWEVGPCNRPANAQRLLTATVAAIGFLGHGLLHTPADAPTLRGILALVTGLVLFGLGISLRRRPAAPRSWGDILLGQALACFTAALALAYSGVTITVLWAALAATVIVTAATTKQSSWLAAGLVVFGLVLCRLLAVDVQLPTRDLEQFAMTLGKKGALAPAFLFNPRTLAAAAAGAGLSVGAVASGRVQSPSWRATAGVLATIAHVLACSLLVVEIRRLITEYPSLPSEAMDRYEFGEFMQQVHMVIQQQEGRLAMLTTLILGVYAIAVLVGGFAARSPYHRYLGLVALNLTLAKLALWDIWMLARIYQVVVLVAVGALLLAAGFLYARFGRRLFGLLQKGAVALIAVVLLPGRANATETHQYDTTAAIQGVGGPGFYALPIDPGLYRATRSEWRFSDLRIVDAAGVDVPFLIRDLPRKVSNPEIQADMLDPVVLPNGAVRATFDLKQSGLRHSEVTLTVADGPSFYRPVRVEVSEDDRAYGLLLQGVSIYRISDSISPTSSTRIRYPLSRARYVRVTVLPGPEQVDLRGASFRFVPPEQPDPVGTIPLRIVSTTTDQNHVSVLLLDAGQAGVPLSALILDIADQQFEREVVVEATNYQRVWPQVGTGEVYRSKDRSNLTVGLANTAKRWFRLSISNKDNPPVNVQRVEGRYCLQEVLFSASGAGTYSMYIGRSDDRAPQYDLAQVVSRAGDVATMPARLGELRANPQRSGEPPIPRAPLTERYRTALRVAMVAIVLIMALWTWRILGSSRACQPSGDGAAPSSGAGTEKSADDRDTGSSQTGS